MGMVPSSWRLMLTVVIVAHACPVSAWGAADVGTTPQAFSRARFYQELKNEPPPHDKVEKFEKGSASLAGTGILATVERLTHIQMRENSKVVQNSVFEDVQMPDIHPDALSAIEDPLESINRIVYEFNQVLVEHFLDPVADFYQTHASNSIQDGITKFFANLREPVTAGSSLLQGSLLDAGNSSARFVLNSTVGLLGFYDPASELGFSPVVRTLDETLCTYGFSSGPYVVMPLFGPSSVRDTAGRVATMLAQYMVLGPFIIPYRITDTAAQHVNVRDQMKFIDSTAQDPYVTHKVLYSKMQILPCGAQTKFARRLFAR